MDVTEKIGCKTGCSQPVLKTQLTTVENYLYLQFRSGGDESGGAKQLNVISILLVLPVIWSSEA